MTLPYGSLKASIMLVAEGPSRSDERAGQVFSGHSGKDLFKMLAESGIDQSECYTTSVSRTNIPGYDSKKYFQKYTKANQIPISQVTAGLAKLKDEIVAIKPNVIIAFGELSLWALTSEMGITKWRASTLSILITSSTGETFRAKVIPTYSPEAITRKYDWRFIALQDLRRCEKESHFSGVKVPAYRFLVRPKLDVVLGMIRDMVVVATHIGDTGQPPPGPYHDIGLEIVPDDGCGEPARLILSGDIETRRGHISCFGFAWTRLDAICIPFACVENLSGYWSEEEEIKIIWELTKLFAHPNIGWVYQNGIYDFQYFAKHWGVIPNLYMDTMLAHHTCWAGLPKGLDFQSSLYCEYHRYWKDEGKEFHESIKTPDEEEKYWIYNCKDCVTTQEITGTLKKVIVSLNQEKPYYFQMRQFPAVLHMMLRGIRIDRKKKSTLALTLLDALAERELWMEKVVGRVFNPRSPKQMKEFFYDEMGLPIQNNRKTKKPTTDSNALTVLAKKEPLIAPLIQCILEFRSIGVFLSTFIKAPLDTDNRMRCSYNIAGTETFRWSSSADAFGTGMNLQNVPKGNEK